jgi:hypothetical protein
MSAALLLLIACAPAPAGVSAPTSTAPQAQSPQPQPTQQPSPQGVTTGPVVDALRAALQSDEVSVQAIELSGSEPATLTVQFTWNEQKMASMNLDIELMIIYERERSVHAITRRVLEQVAAGAPIERVVLQEYNAGYLASASAVALSDMQDWAAGKLDDNQYHARWCCTPP